jgi:hypothetical protein
MVEFERIGAPVEFRGFDRRRIAVGYDRFEAIDMAAAAGHKIESIIDHRRSPAKG